MKAPEFWDPYADLVANQKPSGTKSREWTFPSISEQQWQGAQLSPPVVVDEFAYIEVMLKIAAGGVGKTTLMLYEAIHIVLGRNLWGRAVKRQGKVVIITAEDTDELMTARLRETCRALELTELDVRSVQKNIHIVYVGGENFRLCQVRDDVVEVSPQTDELIEAVKELKPVMIVFDPAISFGVGETRINDAEQGLINAARRILKGVQCVVQIIHHTGQANSRNKVTDAYAGRGGTAMPDGARMVQILHPLTQVEFERATGVQLQQRQHGIAYHLPKLTFCKPQEPFFVIREGFKFDFIRSNGKRDWREFDAEQMERFRNLYEAAVDAVGTPGYDSQSTNWTGYLVAEVLGLDAGKGLKAADRTKEQKADLQKCKEVLAHMRKKKLLVKGEEEQQAKGRTKPVDKLV